MSKDRFPAGILRSHLGCLHIALVFSCLISQFAVTTVHGQSAGTSTDTKSQSCKEAAANKWLLDYTMAHGNVSQAQQLEAIRQVTTFSEAIRKFCGDNRINNELLQSANKGVWPDWIDAEINELLSQL